MITESRVQSEILSKLEKIPNSFWFKVMRANKVGIPDIVGHINGQAVYIEVKRDQNGIISKAQEYIINKCQKTGAVAFRADCWEDCVSNLKQFKGASSN